ncbi:hypothetical protein [Paenibacillus jilunlii]|uniref:Uncharacterized protein n=1 Tax=Paenibacillus jilunlii TaxID=682956 RepID=A0A1H0A2E9_9BACL|nr:hypothetical protein [Paenibacillus jilunlii]KWX79947.1 hypothetical protein AML91_01905 [Paenibacillus jilunlii]SDN27738.1 hypothetical protein SAMN05216191_13441 [Paenibacillus jilunlii]
MTRQEQLKSELEDWKSWLPIYEGRLNESRTVANREQYLHMVEFSKERIQALEAELQQLKSA